MAREGGVASGKGMDTGELRVWGVARGERAGRRGVAKAAAGFSRLAA